MHPHTFGYRRCFTMHIHSFSCLCYLRVYHWWADHKWARLWAKGSSAFRWVGPNLHTTHVYIPRRFYFFFIPFRCLLNFYGRLRGRLIGTTGPNTGHIFSSSSPFHAVGSGNYLCFHIMGNGGRTWALSTLRGSYPKHALHEDDE